MAHVEAVCISSKKGMVKKEQPEVILKTGWGIEGDAHAGDWHRQVSLLAGESIDTVKVILPTLKNGAFAENLITRGLDLSGLKIGDRLQVGAEIILEITQIGKECHNQGCAIKKATGDCIMPKEGLFSRVLQGGKVRPGDLLKPLN
ncbi:MAG: MOSC domain-containing protein [Desulfobulbaceae bacterium]|nr:MOSC domain-containing protein [Desulfobulbaceae bacterium]